MFVAAEANDAGGLAAGDDKCKVSVNTPLSELQPPATTW